MQQQTESNQQSAFLEQSVNIFAKYLSEIKMVGDESHPCVALTHRENFDKSDLIMIGSIIVKYFGERFVLGTSITQELENQIAQNINEIEFSSDAAKANFIRDLEEFTNLQWTASHIYELFNPIIEKAEFEYKNTELIKISAIRQIQNVIRHSLYPTNQAVNIENYLKKEAWTADDLVKMNSLITTVATHTGESLQYSNELYNEPQFIEALDKAITLYNEGKYSIIFMEAIQSFFERIEFYKTQYRDYKISIGQTLNPELFVKHEDSEASKESETTENQESEQSNESEQSEQSENAYLFENNPGKFIEKMIHEVTEQKEFDDTTYSKFIDGLLSDEDTLPHIIKYLKAKTSPTENDHTEFYNTYKDVILAAQRKDAEEYRKIVEIVCQLIGEKAKSVNEHVRSVIKCLMIDTNQHAQYFATQLADDSIETWSHFQELITLIDSCKIRGSKISEYAQLFTFIENTTNYKEIRENFNKIAPIELRLEMHRILIEFMTHQSKAEK